MKCDYCDSKFKEMPEDQVCPNCGATILTLEERKAIVSIPGPPTGTYDGVYGRIDVGNRCVTFFLDIAFQKKTEIVLYDEILKVSFIRATASQWGYLSVRDIKRKNLPLPKKATDALFDETSVCFDEQSNSAFERLYTFLLKCTQCVAEFLCVEDTPLGRYPGTMGYLQIDEDAITISKKILYLEATVIRISYDQILNVAYQEATEGVLGGISISSRMQPKAVEHALKNTITDKTSIDFREYANDAYYKAYCFIKNKMEQAKTTK